MIGVHQLMEGKSKNVILTELSEGDLHALLQMCRTERKRTGLVAGQLVHAALQRHINGVHEKAAPISAPAKGKSNEH